MYKGGKFCPIPKVRNNHGWLNGPFSGRKPKLAQNLTFLAYGIDGVNFLGGPQAFSELVDVQ